MLGLLGGTRPAVAQGVDPCHPSIIATQAARGSSGMPPENQAPPVHGWVDVRLPDIWTDRWPDHDGVVWYRMDWIAGCGLAGLRTQPLALATDSIRMAGQIFVNGDLLWRDTNLSEPLSRGWNMPRSWTLPAATLRQGVNTILIQVSGASIASPGLGEVRLGAPLALREREARVIWNHRTMFAINMVGSLCIASLFLMIWLFYRKAGIYIWFAALNVSWMVFLHNVTATETWPFSSTAGTIRANAIAFMVFCLCFAHFMFRLADRPLGRRSAVLTMVSTAFMTLCVAAAPQDVLVLVSKIGIRSHLLLFALTCLALAWRALRSRRAGDWLCGGMGLVYCAIALHDGRAFHLQLGAGVVPLTPYANLLTMIGLSLVMGARVARSMRRTEQFSDELRLAVGNACDELEKSLRTKHELALSNTRLQERVDLIQDIHDGFGSALVRAITLAEADGHDGPHRRRHVSMLKSLRDDLRLVIDGGQGLAKTVPPSPQAWMAPTRYRFSSLFDDIGVKNQWRQPAAWRHPPSAMTCLTLTRFMEEALSNVLKHSRADSVTVVMSYSGSQDIALEIEDNGIGFDVERADRMAAGIGLQSMRARLGRLDGTVAVSSVRGRTVVRATMPQHGC